MHHTDHIIPNEPRQLPPDGALYFVGIGGAGMSAIAQVLAERGRTIRGADPGISAAVKARLEAVGATIYTGHDAANVGADVSAVVVSDAIPQANPEVIAAKERGIPIYRRPEVLGAIVNAGRGIAIAGTHGKTTTTGMVASILMAANLDPTVLIGGDLPLIGGNARNGKGEFVVAESCEAYDGFLYLHPEVAVVLNIEADHLDYHGTEQHVFDSFKRFIGQVNPKGLVVFCEEDAKTLDVINKWSDAKFAKSESDSVGVSSYSIESGSLYEATNVRTEKNGMSFDIVSGVHVYAMGHNPRRPQARIRLSVPGRHNMLNALAAFAVAQGIGVPVGDIVRGLESFTGTGRRFERLGEVGGVTVIDDYAHHPTELRATLSAARSAFPGRRIVAVFQPHLPSRTRDLMGEFAESLAHEFADAVFVTDIYLAREQPIAGVTSGVLADAIDALADQPEIIRYVPNKADLPEHLAAFVQPGDVVITLGAG
ncbi:MAG: UDP-N-acetylmuramate--L-alanine ligase, partial [Akkermansiaceae bacterium]|nr:UDP-N-acetylmuramate--L-alanine ligase [Armatimonadota bacterium]